MENKICLTTDLGCHLWLGAQFQYPFGKWGSSLVVAQLEEEVQGCPKSQDQVDWLQVAVGEIGSQLS